MLFLQAQAIPVNTQWHPMLKAANDGQNIILLS